MPTNFDSEVATTSCRDAAVAFDAEVATTSLRDACPTFDSKEFPQSCRSGMYLADDNGVPVVDENGNLIGEPSPGFSSKVATTSCRD